MARRYSFLVIFLALLTPLAWWSGRVETSAAQPAPTFPGFADGQRDAPADPTLRRDLIEVLDRLVAYEHYYRSVYGHFTKLLTRLGYSVPGRVGDLYAVHVSEASRDRLVLSAFSEIDGRTRDVVTIDQDYVIHASFAVPPPRPEYLKGLALKQLRLMRDSPAGQTFGEQGVFTGYFRFEQKRDSQDRKVAFAVGVKPPVVGVQLELGAADLELADLGASGSTGQLSDDYWGLSGGAVVTGQKPVSNVMSTLEEAYLAQRIFHGEVGRYAKNWSELSRIASFRFEDKAKFGQEGQVPFGDAGSVLEIDGSSEKSIDNISQESARYPSSELEPLEIEPIFPAAKTAKQATSE